MSSRNHNPAAEGRRTARHWLCIALVLLIGMTRQLVICTHQGGQTHIEFAHQEGASSHHGHHHGGCNHAHFVIDARGGQHGAQQHAHPDGDDCDDPHSSCDHVHLSVDVGPKPLPDVVDLPFAQPIVLWLHPELQDQWASTERPAQPPPATGPPRPRPRQYLALRASTVLLI
ncbi:MAG: hypothetical protein ACE37K_09050 [Planctomycetota bacterium]